jgi:hypothetical protein
VPRGPRRVCHKTHTRTCGRFPANNPYALDAAGLKPISQSVEILREAPELSHRRWVAVLGNCNPVTLTADIDAGGIQVDPLEDLFLSLATFVRSSLLNGITRCVSPMKISRHPPAKLSSGDEPPMGGRPRPPGTPCIVPAMSTASAPVFCPRIRARRVTSSQGMEPPAIPGRFTKRKRSVHRAATNDTCANAGQAEGREVRVAATPA